MLGKKKIPEVSYKETKEYLDRQQNIDLLLVLTKFVEPQVVADRDIQKKAENQIANLLEKLK